MKMGIKILGLVELGFRCQNFPFPQLFSRAYVKPLRKWKRFDIFQQVHLIAKNFFMVVFIDLWPCLFTTKLSYAQLRSAVQVRSLYNTIRILLQ